VTAETWLTAPTQHPHTPATRRAATVRPQNPPRTPPTSIGPPGRAVCAVPDLTPTPRGPEAEIRNGADGQTKPKSQSRSRSRSKPSRGTGGHPASEEPHTSHRNRGTGTHQASEEPKRHRPKPWQQAERTRHMPNGHRAFGATQRPPLRGAQTDPHDRSQQADEERHTAHAETGAALWEPQSRRAPSGQISRTGTPLSRA
jgi:hypothetical protein